MATAEHEPLPSPIPRRWLAWQNIAVIVATMLIATLVAIALPTIQSARERHRAMDEWGMAFYTTSGSPFPWYIRWIHRACGYELFFDHTLIVTNGMVLITDDMLAAITCFENLVELRLNGEAVLTEAGLQNLKKLTRLERLHVGQAAVTEDVVVRLRREMPRCDITWEPPAPSPRDSWQEEPIEQ